MSVPTEDQIAPDAQAVQAYALNLALKQCPGARIDATVFAATVSGLNLTPDQVRDYGSDLALALACVAGDTEAIAWFEREFIARVPQYVASFRCSEDQLQELKQRLRILALAGPAPRLSRYSGRGPLGAWIRVTTIRLAVNAVRALSEARDDDRTALSSLALDGGGPELETIRSNCLSIFNGVIDTTLAQLSPRDRTLLRLFYIDGLSIDGIGAVYQVHRATAARWLVTIRQTVLDGIKDHVKNQLGANSNEFLSLVKIVRDDVSLSLSRLLMEGQRPATHSPRSQGA